MSTASYRDFGTVAGRLWMVRTRWKTFLVLRGVLAFAVVFLSAMLLVAITEGLIHLPVFGRVLLLALSLLCLAFALVAWVVRPAFKRLTDEEVARHIEEALPEVGNNLINAVQLSRDELAPSKELVDAAITETAAASAKQNLRLAVSPRLLTRLSIVGAGLLAALLLFSVLFPGRLGNALLRVVYPTDRTLPAVGSVEIVEMTPASSPVAVVFGEPLEVKARYRATGSRPVKAAMAWEYSTGERREVEMSPAGADTFDYRIPSVEVPLEYSVRLDDTTSGRFKVEVLQKPFVESVDLEYRYPGYTGLVNKTETGSKTGSIEAPAGTFVKVRGHVNRPVSTGEIRFAGDSEKAVVLSTVEGGRAVEGLVYVWRDQDYSFYLVDPKERASEETGRRQIRSIPDQKPTADILSPAKDTNAFPGETLELAARATDDYGLAKLVLWMKRNDEKPVALKTSMQFENPKAETMTYALELKAQGWRSGETISIYAEAADACEVGDPSAPADTPRHHRVTSATRVITLRDRAEEQKKLTEDVRSWKERLEEVLHIQQKARAAASTLDPAQARDEFLTRSTAVGKDQLDVYQRTLSVSEDMGKLDGEAARVARLTLAVLERNEMTQAVELADTVSKLERKTDLGAPRDELLSVQDKIIATLKKVLDILPQIEKQTLGEGENAAGTEMPQDSKKAWKDLADKLKEFVDQEKKVIAQTEDLAKKPVDDFTPEDQDKLKELAAVEDEWSKFMQELQKDLSKLPNQDFSNPSLLKELLAVQEDVQKAADALTRKAVEIAVPLEQSGVENAKELTTHIEKWLPDSADRDQWKMEEPVQDLNTPMAELPKELEDIVGDLMEQEEDLFDEVEDASSSWADSIDKGAGWDAMDGPISNMSAQGVTGNRLPNSSEIGGRSGEGRTGKAGGEMVGDEAVGKGGRRTPTRLTPDPYQAGEVKDSSKEPAGGATGGGKVSGAAPEGLEGPVPPPLAKKMERLAGKQADIRNKAERVSVAFKVLKYPTTEADKLVADMKSVEDDLKNYRYRNVLRQKSILLKGLGTEKLMAHNEITVGKDYSATLPPEVQREIMDTAERELPAEYREIVQKYYESLSEK
jgi:tetratricopeptide (TPR) repeat protein